MIIPINKNSLGNIKKNTAKNQTKGSSKQASSENKNETVISISFNSSIEDTIDLNRINELRHLITNGNYEINPKGIAAAIMKLHESDHR